ncbi:c-type cytochrome biogenesis protein CcmI [Yoonia sp. BS5-3]|uniref:C-type cytochrome biogenesis protein CcmI n=1 Tax=Yoonia phaeophyticola TaxID=3137369 RepID=A0ABZ2V1E4_9RHOB
MLFWLTCIVMTLAATAVITVPLLRPAPRQDESTDVAIYQAQLAEIERDLERGLLEPQEAENARVEVARRLLAANRSQQKADLADRPSRWGAPLVVLFCLVLAVVLYVGPAGIARQLGMSEDRITTLHELAPPLFFEGVGRPGYIDLPLQARLDTSETLRANRPSQAALEAIAPPPPAVDLPEDYRAAIAQLRAIAPTRPDDLEAWSRLAFHEVELRNYAGAAAAQAQVITIQGDAASLTDWERLLDLQVVAAGGAVSPESEAVINRIMTANPDSIPARYYLGALYYQTDRADLAFRIWRKLVEREDPNDFHVANARAQITDVAYFAGIEYALPETRGPSFEQMDAAADLTPEEQAEMIGGMVSGLAERLATEGGPAEDWARLIRAYAVLGDFDAASTVWQEAQQVFVSSMRDMEILTNAARDAGVLE